MALTLKRLPRSNPQHEAFVRRYEDEAFNNADGTLNRAALIEEVLRMTGVRVHDVGNTHSHELKQALRVLVDHFLNGNGKVSMPRDIKHLVIGHAVGADRTWTFLGGMKVHDYINRHVPKGERAWTIACKTDADVFIDRIEGWEVVSQGPAVNSTHSPPSFTIKRIR